MMIVDEEILSISRALNAAADAGEDMAALAAAWLACFERQTAALRRQHAPLAAVGMVALRHEDGCRCPQCGAHTQRMGHVGGVG